MATARTTEVIVSTPDYFVAKLDNGGVRVGMYGAVSIDFPSGHKLHNEASKLDGVSVEFFFDKLVETGYAPLNAF